MNEFQPNYYAVIPAKVRYDKHLKPNEKLLYGEITALTNKYGECWASNRYFSELYGTQQETISRWISNLKNKGYITVKIIRKEDNQIEKRILKIINDPIDEKINRYCQKNQEGIDEKINRGIDEKVKENNTSNINNTSINISPISPYKNFKEETNYQDETYLKINDWLMYKEEKQQNYKERGLMSLFTQLKKNIAEYGEQAVCNVISESMANGYQGIMWDKLARTSNQANNKPFLSELSKFALREELRNDKRSSERLYFPTRDVF